MAATTPGQPARPPLAAAMVLARATATVATTPGLLGRPPLAAGMGLGQVREPRLDQANRRGIMEVAQDQVADRVAALAVVARGMVGEAVQVLAAEVVVVDINQFVPA